MEVNDVVMVMIKIWFGLVMLNDISSVLRIGIIISLLLILSNLVKNFIMFFKIV